MFNRRNYRKAIDVGFAALCFGASVLSMFFLLVLLWEIFRDGVGVINWTFITSSPSRFPAKAGIWSPLIGTLWVIGLTGLISVPVGTATAIYLEEYARDGWLRRIIQTNISNLAGVPSIVYGILGLGLFVRMMHLNRSVIAGALTLSLVVLPIVIISAQEALRTVPDSIRTASYALGATRWQTVRHQVLPASLPGIMTGIILAMSRAIGEAAPLVTIGALTYITFVPEGIRDPFAALPIQIFNWSQRPQDEFRELAAGGIIVLLVVLLLMNATAVWIRHYFGKRIKW